jgi:hypothetical protein
MNIWEHTTAGNCDIAEQLVELLAHSQLKFANSVDCALQ